MSLGELLTTGGVGLLTGGKSDPLKQGQGVPTALKQGFMKGVPTALKQGFMKAIKGIAGQTDWLGNLGLSPGSSDSDNKPQKTYLPIIKKESDKDQ